MVPKGSNIHSEARNWCLSRPEELADIIFNQKLLAEIPQHVKCSHNRFDLIVQTWILGFYGEAISMQSHHKINQSNDYLPQLPIDDLHTSSGRMISPHREVFLKKEPSCSWMPN
jgi:hypothetical protein